MFLALDIESSDLLKRELPLGDPSQPWIVSVAAALLDVDGNEMDFFYTRVRAADGATIRQGAQAVHGISSREAARSGVPQVVALGMLCHFAAQARYVIGYGLSFDRQMVESALIRANKDTKLWVRPGLEFINLLLIATPICKLPHKEPRTDGQFKWPALSEAQSIILGEPPREGQHNAWDDLQITRRLFVTMLNRGLLEIAA